MFARTIVAAHEQTASFNSFRNPLPLFAALFILILAAASSAGAQSAESLSSVKKVYLESFGQEEAASKLRARLIKQLRKSGKLEVVSAASEADAVIKGSESIWVAGYFSTDFRTASTTRQPIIQGYLSVEMVGKDNEPLWSYLVTPSKFRIGSISQDLADQLAVKVLAALEPAKDIPPLSPVANRPAEVNLTGAGATFPAPLYLKWFESFQRGHPNSRISYKAVGSEAGIRLIADGKVDFAASDVPLSGVEMPESKGSFVHFPTVLGAVVPIYNLGALDRTLNFTPDMLAEIYLGKIKKWSDPKIRASNRNIRLPNSDIVVIHRSDGSGTTFVWTDFLSKVSLQWKTTVGSGATVNWPVGSGAEGNDAVASMVQQTPNSIGYVELVYALRHQLNFGAVQNAAGQFVQADLTSVTAAASRAAGAMTPDFRVSITNPPGKGAYPISTFTWWLFPSDMAVNGKKSAYLELLQWMLTDGQKECSALGYAPLPREIVTRELQSLTTFK
ncbi:MAG TPA: phosphate ABC transporter substrate-binding protein PstS [Candidatus Acidoferrum sp.]|nr:phosphate ABC transporter substrate-binding protein PstS [Candidatus Acidoferrum sp.]